MIGDYEKPSSFATNNYQSEILNQQSAIRNPQSAMNAVVITGLGLVTPLGGDAPTSWKNLIDKPIPSPGRRTGEGCDEGTSGVPSPCTLSHLSAGEGCARGFQRAREMAGRACLEALKDAGLWDGERLAGVDPARAGCTVSASKPLFEGVWLPPDRITSFVRDRFGLRGESRNVIAACATGAYAAALGASWVEEGLCDVVVVGSVEPFPHPLIEAGFRRMGVVSREPVMRPFDRRRSGFVFGEGAGVIVLESTRSAKARGVKPRAQISGWGLGADSHSPVAFNSDGERVAEVIARALNRARILPASIGHVNAHGTATRLNDWLETRALLKAFGRHAGRLMISATKADTGHLLGAAGSVELAFTVLALQHQFVPGTSTLQDPDPACALDYTPGGGHPAPFDHALSLSFGFGGPIGVLVVSAC
jgi:3-oxoacyl-[acyl-carrier-protein] synthase II